jgi:hypothetical protein
LWARYQDTGEEFKIQELEIRREDSALGPDASIWKENLPTFRNFLVLLLAPVNSD